MVQARLYTEGVDRVTMTCNMVWSIFRIIGYVWMESTWNDGEQSHSQWFDTQLPSYENILIMAQLINFSLNDTPNCATFKIEIIISRTGTTVDTLHKQVSTNCDNLAEMTGEDCL